MPNARILRLSTVVNSVAVLPYLIKLHCGYVTYPSAMMVFNVGDCMLAERYAMHTVDRLIPVSFITLILKACNELN